MLSELCGYLRNWFEKEMHFGDFTLDHGVISGSVDLHLLENQYIRIVGSVLNDGVYQYKAAGITGLVDEAFNGAIWSLAIPKDVINLDAEITAWQAKYGAIDSEAMSPFTSESFGGYSYSKNAGATNNGNIGNGWQSVFGGRLSQWRKI